MSKSNRDARLRAASQKVLDSMRASAMKTEEEHVFSPDFEKRMNDLIRRTGRRERVASVCSRIAAVFAVVLLGTATFVAVNPMARAEVAGMWELYEDRASYFFNNGINEIPEEMPQYEVTWLPEELEEKDAVTTTTGTYAYYATSNLFGNMVSFSCIYMTDGNHVEILADPDEVLQKEDVAVNEYSADYYEGNGGSKTNVLIWVDEEKNLLFSLVGTYEKDVMIAMAESVQLVNSPK